jgi:hypothetical protein
VIEAPVGEDGSEPRPDVNEPVRPQDEQRLHRPAAQQTTDEELECEGDPHEPEKQVGDVAPEVAEDATSLGERVEPRNAVTEALGSPLVTDAVVEAAVEDAVRVVPLVQPGTVVVLGQPMFRTERAAAAPTLVRQVLVTAALVALSHYASLTVAPTKRGAFVGGAVRLSTVGRRRLVVPVVVRRDDRHVIEPRVRVVHASRYGAFAQKITHAHNTSEGSSA